MKEAISKNQVIGLIVALTGVSMIITEGNLSAFLTMGFELIDVILLGAVVCWALYSVIGKVVLRKYNSLVSTTYGIVFGTLFLFPFAYMETSLETIANSSFVSWVAIAHMSIFVTVISFVMYYYGIQQIGAAKASIFINFMPISASILATIFFQEAFALAYLIGAALVLTGVTLSTYKRRIMNVSKS
ncbi:MAG: DMT family transporter [Bacillaceae bacterium]|nr:DMT family transporter [Bacillaceae bacterium]